MSSPAATPSSSSQTPDYVGALLADIEASPTPFHAVETAASRLVDAGFTPQHAEDPIPSAAGAYFTIVSGSLLAWVQPGSAPEAHPGFCVVGAHTDSPNLRIKAKPDYTSGGWAQLGVSIYGGALLNSWLDRDLGLAGRVVVRTEAGTSVRLFKDDTPFLRVPQLAIHLDREIRDKGLLLNPQTHMDPLWATGDASFVDYLAKKLDVEADDIVTWDVMAHDTQVPGLVGQDGEFIASARIDNLFSSFCGVYAIGVAAQAPDDLGRIPVLALYDHEEVGSLSATGADGVSLARLLERISLAVGLDRAAHLEGLASSIVVSADGAHATHPNYVDKHDPQHQIAVNAGIVIKQNVNQRYATDVESEAWLRAVCEANGVPVQTYIHRNDLPCGSTIGPISAGRLGIATVDCGAPQLAMHSAREMAGALDVEYLVTTLRGAFLA